MKQTKKGATLNPLPMQEATEETVQFAEAPFTWEIEDGAAKPEYATAGSVGMDLSVFLKEGQEIEIYTAGNYKRFSKVRKVDDELLFVLQPGERVAAPTGVKVNLAPGYWLQAYPRSGLSLKEGVTLINAVGVIDTDYKDEIRATLVNTSNAHVHIKNGQRVAQLVLQKSFHLSDSPEVRNGGFGSTGE